MPDLLYLSRADVERVALPMAEIIAALESMFREKGAGRVEMPPKPGIHPLPDAFLHAMPAHIPALGATGVKWVSGYPQNQARGLPYINGLLILNDPETGVPTAVMDCTWITAMRTGAASAVAAKHFARPDSATLGIVACGVQGRSHVTAMACLYDLERIYAFDLHRAVAERFAIDVTRETGVKVEVVDTPRAAVERSDLVVTSGPILRAPSPVVEPDWLAAGSFASLVDFDSYVTGNAMRAVDRIVTDDVAQMEYYRGAGYFADTPAVDCELGDVVCGKRPGRASDDERALCINLGIALDDMATAILVLERAVASGVGTRLPL